MGVFSNIVVSFGEFGFDQISGQSKGLNDCNIYINHSQALQNSLACNYENGIIINSDNVTLDLNRSALLGSGYLNPYTGITIADKSNIILKEMGFWVIIKQVY